MQGTRGIRRLLCMSDTSDNFVQGTRGIRRLLCMSDTVGIPGMFHIADIYLVQNDLRILYLLLLSRL